MKLSILVFSLIILYWACIICAEKDSNSRREEDVIDLDKDTSIYHDVSWERPLSRNKRSLIISPVANLLLSGLGKSAGIMAKPILKLFEPALDFCGFAYGILIGKNMCPKVENLDLVNLLQDIVLRPIKTIETVLCYVTDMIGIQGRALVRVMLEQFVLFVRKILMPGLHKMLNTVNDKFPLPPSIKSMIEMFNAVYAVMKLLGMVG